MSPLIVLAGVAGLGTGLGAYLLVLGLRRDPRTSSFRPGAGRWRARQARRGRRRIPGGVVLGAVGAGVAAGVVTGWIAAAVLAAAATVALPRLLRGPAEPGQLGRLEAIAVWAERLAATLAGGAGGLEQTLLATTRTPPTPIRAELAALAERLHRGESLPGALHQLAGELADPAADLVIATLLLAATHPTRHLAPALAALGATTRTQVTARLRVEAGRARQRTSVRVIVTTTVLFSTALVLAPGTLLAPYDSPVGQLVLLAVGTVFGTAFWWLAHLARTPPLDRYLPTPTSPTAAPTRPQAPA